MNRLECRRLGGRDINRFIPEDESEMSSYTG
jgi:hypothetical protein